MNPKKHKYFLSLPVATVAALAGLAIGAFCAPGAPAVRSTQAAPTSKSASKPASKQVSKQVPRNSAFYKSIAPYLNQHCSDCHADGAKKGGMNLDLLLDKLSDAATFARWERIFDQVNNGVMPPKKVKDRPTAGATARFKQLLSSALTKAHKAENGTVLRRLNRREYQNTMNDIFGTTLDLETLLPQDGRSHEFDNVGDALGVSMVHLQRYLQAAGIVFDSAIAKTTEAPKPTLKTSKYTDDKGSDQFIGQAWKKLPDGAIVRFQSHGYPSGMLRSSGVRKPGFYKIKVTGYAHQSKTPITFSVGGTSYKPGSEKPTYGYFSFPPNKPTTVELTAYIDTNFMIQVEPYGISDPDRYQRKKKKIDISTFKGPGLAIRSVTVEGPLVKEFPTRGHKLIFDRINRKEIQPRNPNEKKKSWYKPRFEIISSNKRKDAAQSIKRIAAVAFRRPVTGGDIAPYVKLFDSQLAKGNSFEEALRTAVTALFCSPNFLYLRETPGRLKDHALANRLAYFLTRTLPDAELAKAANQHKLTRSPAALRAQTDRLLKHPHFARFITDFTESWLNLREMDFTVPDKTLFPEFDPYLRYSMPLETEAFLGELIQSNLSVTNIVKSDFVMVNDRLAAHYGIPGVKGSAMQKIKLPAGTPRGGFITQGSVMKVSANGTNTSPVLRGVWVMERILGQTPTPPPPGIPGVEPDIRGAETLRDLLDKHRNSLSCKVCHQIIDPLGFPLESFNPIGGFRDTFRSLNSKGPKSKEIVAGRQVRYRIGPKVDASGQFADGRKFANYIEFRDHLAKEDELLAKAITTKLLTFATGREMGFSDRPEIDRIVKLSSRKGHGMGDLIHLIITSDIFLTK